MTFKLTKSQIQALELALSQAIKYEHVGMNDKLLICILSKFYKKLVVKLLDLKKTYTVTFDEPTALAFYLYFYQEVYVPTDQAANTIKLICNATEKQFT